MEQLHARERATGVDLRREAGQAGDHRVVVAAQLARPGLAVLGHVRRTALDEAEAPLGALAEERLLELRARAIGMALHVGERREPDAVSAGDPVPKDERREEGGHAGRIF